MEIDEQIRLLTPLERRQRNRQEVIDAIVAAARQIMRQEGVAALNLHEVARSVGMQTPSLYKYFPSKFALYEELFRMAVLLFSSSEEEIWKSSRPIWERIRTSFETRLQLVHDNPDLYHLMLDNPVPGFVPSEESLEEVQKIRIPAVGAIREAMEAGLIITHLPPDRVLDLLLVLRRGIIAEYLGKKPHLPPEDERFRSLIPEALAILKEAWTPNGNNAEQAANPAYNK